MVLPLAVRPFPFSITPMSNVPAASYADGATFTRALAYLQQFINDELVTNLNIALAEVTTEYQEGVANAEATITAAVTDWDTKWAAFLANTTLELAALQDAANADVILNELSETHAALKTIVEEWSISPAELAAAVNGLNEAIALKLDAGQRGAAGGVASLGADGKVPAGQLPAIVTTLDGSFAGRPAANTLTPGTTYYAYDVMETYRTDGTNWSTVGAGGNELAFTGLAGNVPMFSTTSANYVQVPNLSVNVLAGTRPVAAKFEVYAAIDLPGTAVYALYVDGAMRREFTFRSAGTDEWETFGGEAVFRDLTPGVAYVIDLRVKTVTANSTARTSGAPYIKAVNQ